MAVPIIYGADVGTQLSRNIRQGLQSDAQTSSIRASTRQQRLQTEEFILDAQRRKAERSLGTATAESQLKRLPSQETIEIMKNTEMASQASQLSRRLNLEANIGEQAGNILAKATADNWKETQETLGEEVVSQFGLEGPFDSSKVDQAISGVVNNIAQRRVLDQKLSGVRAPEGKMANFQAVSKDGKRTAAVDYSQSTGYRVQVGKNKDGTAKWEALDPLEWNLTKKSETTTVDPLKPTTATMTDLQKKLVKFTAQASLLKGLAKDFTSEYLTNYGKILGYAGETMDAFGDMGRVIDSIQQQAWGTAGEDSRSIIEWNAQRSEYVQRINRFFNAYRHDITGAQASFAELKKLEDAILNQTMGPAEANISIISFIEHLEEKMEETTQLLQNGFKPYTAWSTDKEGNQVAAPEILIPIGLTKPVQSVPFDLSKTTKRTSSAGTVYYEHN